MTKTDNLDDLTDEELEKLLEEDGKKDLKADESSNEELEEANSSDAIVYKDEEEKPIEVDEETIGESEELKADSAISSKIKEEILVKSAKEERKEERQRQKDEKRYERQKDKMIKKHRKALAKNPGKLIRYDTDPEMGLSLDVVDKRILDNLVNVTNNKQTKSIFRIIMSNVFTFFNILTFIIAGILISVQAITDLAFLVIVLANMIIGTIQEIRAKNTIDKLSLMSAPTAIVRRAGVNHEVAVSEVVLDDLLLLENGKQICADSIVVEGQVEVNESLLTGESDAIVKKPGDVLYSGSFVVSGKCKARVDKIGKDNYIEKLTGQAKQYKKPNSDLLKSLNLIITVMAVLIIPIGGLLFYIMHFKTGLDLVYSIRKTAGAMIGMIPSGLFLCTSTALAIGVIRLASRKVLVQELYCIEMLARVNCICLDKTGTITDGTMSVKNVIDYNTFYGLATKNIISAMLNALEDTNLTSKALEESFGLGKRIKHTASIPFSSQRKYQAVTFDKFGTFILGAPEFVFKEKYSLIKKDVDKYAALGYRVLCLAHREGTIIDGSLPTSEVEIVSMILIEDNIRPDAINTIKYFKESGVQVRVISGDNPITVSKISQRAGIENAEDYISLDGMSESEVRKVALKYTVFGRVSPAQKKLLVQILQENGKTVAMTGDGVNDILALKEADCSIAVASGSEAARNVSHLVLLDSNFDSMPKVVAEGRRVINNVTGVAALFLTKTIFSLLLAIQTLFSGTYPISTNQLILIDLLAIGIPSFVLVLEPNNKEVQGKFMLNVIKRALPGALTILIISMIVFGLQDALSLDSTSLSTIIVIAATHTCLMVLFKTCRPFNTLRKILCTACYAVFIFAIMLLPQFLEFRPIFKFAEYYSAKAKTSTISSYPEVKISKDNYYIIDGVVTSFTKNASDKTDYFTAKYINNNYYYSINGSNDTTISVPIPQISFDYYGDIYLAGAYIDNVKYSDVISFDEEGNMRNALRIDSNGLLYVDTDLSNESNEENNKKDYVPLMFTLPANRNNSYYNHYIAYGTAKEKQVQYKVMPTITVTSSAITINSKSAYEFTDRSGNLVTYRYRCDNLPSDLSKVEYSIDVTTDRVLINGNPIYYTDSDSQIHYYTVTLPDPTTNANLGPEDENSLYLGAISTQFNIFELYGAFNADEETYTLTSGEKEITYRKESVPLEKSTGLAYFLKEVLTSFDELKNNGVNIDVSSTLTVVPQSSYYQLQKGSSVYPNADPTETRTGVSINESSICPDLEVTEAGYYIINGYYTPYLASNGDLNPKMDSNSRLVLGGTTTDYIISSEDVISVTGVLVQELNITCKIFLLMLCLLSAPAMKLLQSIVPWIKKQIAFIQKILSKF